LHRASAPGTACASPSARAPPCAIPKMSYSVFLNRSDRHAPPVRPPCGSRLPCRTSRRLR
jgi:hypothetical protein